ncbi:MAG: TolB family protein [Mycetocola sp.]
MSPRHLADGQRARLHIHDAVTGEDTVVYESDSLLFEAPNWSADDATLYVNGDGRLFSYAISAGTLTEVPHTGLPPINNDHCLAPDGTHVYLSADDGHLYRGALSGGPVTRVSSEEGVRHYLHGVSPDGERLAFVRITSFDQPGLLSIIPSAGGDTTIVDTGPGHIDGPEWTPDGAHILFNSERWADRPGHAQLARIPDGGGEVERLVTSDTVDWFPHPSPDGQSAIYIEFPQGTLGHPADLDVAIVVVSTDDWTTPLRRIRLPGGQGTINVNPWSPGSRRFAYVSYPMGDA